MLFLLNVFGVGVSCRILYSIVSYLCVSCSGSITWVREGRANLSAIVYSFVVSVRRGCLFFLWVLGMGCVILLWHSMSLPYNYSVTFRMFVHINFSSVKVVGWSLFGKELLTRLTNLFSLYFDYMYLLF